MGFDLIMIVPLLPSHCGFSFVFVYRVSFSVGSSIFFVDGCSAVICDFGVSVRRGELTSLYSAILSRNFPDKDFNSAILNMFKELKEIVSKELRKV